MSEITQRKEEHLDLCATEAVAFRTKTTLFEDVHLVHDALPDLDLDAIDLACAIVGRPLSAPLVIAGMTGGVPRAEVINRDLARVAQKHGLALGFGSMRPLLERGARDGYFVRDVAPDVPLFGNLGLAQVLTASDDAITHLLGETDVNALCVHLNLAQEVVQPGGDRHFRGGLARIAHLAATLPVPVIVKETGCGLSRAVGVKLRDAGVKTVDVGGAGGTSWVGVETLRARAATRALGEAFWDWGIPTAASVLQLRGLGLDVIATGGLSNGVDVAKAIALGARAAGIARPFLMAWQEGGVTSVSERVEGVVLELRTAMALTGSANLADLAAASTVCGPTLARWTP